MDYIEKEGRGGAGGVTIEKGLRRTFENNPEKAARIPTAQKIDTQLRASRMLTKDGKRIPVMKNYLDIFNWGNDRLIRTREDLDRLESKYEVGVLTVSLVI